MNRVTRNKKSVIISLISIFEVLYAVIIPFFALPFVVFGSDSTKNFEKIYLIGFIIFFIAIGYLYFHEMTEAENKQLKLLVVINISPGSFTTIFMIACMGKYIFGITWIYVLIIQIALYLTYFKHKKKAISD